MAPLRPPPRSGPRLPEAGPSALPRSLLGWASEFGDFDHDGDEDLVVFNGHVYPQATPQVMDSDYRQPPALW